MTILPPTYLEQLQSDQAAITEILQAPRGVSAETMQPSIRVLWQIYLIILEDALSVLKSQIEYLTTKVSSD